MTIVRIINDIPRNSVGFVVSAILFDKGKITEQKEEDDGEFTIIAEFPDLPAVTARTSVRRAAPAVASAPTAAVSASEQTPEAKWLAVAKGELGILEISGTGSNPRIEEFHATTDGGAELDSVPWCSSFVNFCVEKTGISGTGRKNARSWSEWGKDADAFVLGCIVVLKRGSPPKGHVGFFVGTENGNIRLLGGNQSNSVNIASFDPSRVLARRVAA